MKPMPPDYALSLMQAMGYSAQRGIGKTNLNNDTDLYQPTPRADRLGLGARLPGMPQLDKPVRFPVGSRVSIVQGVHEGLHGIVVEIIDSTKQKRPFRVKVQPSKAILKLTLEELRQSTDQLKNRRERSRSQSPGRKEQDWTRQGLIVRVVDKKSTHYMQKAFISSKYKDELTLVFSNGAMQVFSQKMLETVIPKKGEDGVIVNGPYKGSRATLQGKEQQEGWVLVRHKEQLKMLKLGLQEFCKYRDI